MDKEIHALEEYAREDCGEMNAGDPKIPNQTEKSTT